MDTEQVIAELIEEGHLYGPAHLATHAETLAQNGDEEVALCYLDAARIVRREQADTTARPLLQVAR